MIDKNDPRLTAYVLGELSVEEVAEIEQQIQASPELAEAVEEIRGLGGELAAAYGSEETLSLSTEQTKTIHSKQTPPKSDERRRWLALATAACLAAIVFGGWFWLEGMGRSALSKTASDWTFFSTPYSEEDTPATVDGYSIEGAMEEEPAMEIEEVIDAHDRRTQDADGDQDPQSTAIKMRLLEAASALELQKKQTGTGHPDYEAAKANADIIRKQLANVERESSRVADREGQFRGGRIVGGGGMGGRSDGQSLVDEETEGWGYLPRRPSVPSPSAAEPESLMLGEQGLVGDVLEIEMTESEGRESPSDQGRGRPQETSPFGERNTETAGKNDEQSRLSEGRGKQFDGEDSTRNSGKSEESKTGKLKDKSKPKPKPKSWKRVKATPNTTRLMVGDKEELTLNGMQVNAQVDGFRARVLVDYFYYNDQERQLEGDFKLRLPDDASLYYFAFGESAYEVSPKGKLAKEEFLDDGTQFVSLGAANVKEARRGQWDNVKEARMVPREKAAHAFRETVRRRVDPALVEWSGAGVFQAKVFPLSPKKLHRIVVGYDVNLKRSGDDLTFELSLPEQTGQCRVEVNVQSIEGMTVAATPAVDPFPREQDGTLQKRFVFDNDEAPLTEVELTLSRIKDALLKSEEGEFWTMQVTPDLPAEEVASNSRAIFLLDTSLSSNPDKFNVWLKLLETTLESNRDSLKEFDVLFFDIDSHFWNGKYVANTAKNVARLKEFVGHLALEGATDLHAAAATIADAKWIAEDGSGPDLFLLSDGAATWGETDLRMIDERLQAARCGSLFAYQTGLTGTAIANLRFLTGQTGGAVFSVAGEDEIKTAATAHRKRPWQLSSIASGGATDILTAGRVKYVYPGQTITVVGRGEVTSGLELNFDQGEETLTETVTPILLPSELASRMYGQVAVGQLENLGTEALAESVATAYARHFRITGRTCSLLMLETEEDYERFDIKPEEDQFVVNAKAASTIVRDTLKQHAEALADPKARLKAWLDRLESMPGMKFQWPTALELVYDDIEIDSISQPLDCSLTKKESFSKSYWNALNQQPLDYEAIATEALLRKSTSVDDMLKVYSSLVEQNPGDITVARDVAFTAMELERPAAAFYLLRRVAEARPFQGNIYPAIGQCLAQLGKADMAMVYYEVAINGSFERQGGEFKTIVAAQYTHLLRQMVDGKLESSDSGKAYAKARLDTLGKHLPFRTADVVITMMWNQDQTDVDLHVIEPSGEECFYKHKKTRSGGEITSDITTGFGPEMYFNANAPRGKYQVKAKFFGSSQNRRSTRNKVYLTIIEDFGGEEETLSHQTVELRTVGGVEKVMTVGVGSK